MIYVLKSLFVIMVIIVSCVGPIWASTLADANAVYESGDRDAAKELYEDAAKAGNADAHFLLTYRYVLPLDKQLFHLAEASKQGHVAATDAILDALFFRPAKGTADPKRAWLIYHQALKANPKLTTEMRYKNEYLEALEICSKLPAFDLWETLSGFGITEQDIKNGSFYFIWELAEEASVGGRFGAADPELTMQLIVQGGNVPFEVMRAVKGYAPFWQKNKAHPFNMGDYISSGMGAYHVSTRNNRNREKKYEKLIRRMEERIGGDAAIAVRQSLELASRYYWLKASYEEGNTGSSRWKHHWISTSSGNLKEELIQDLNRIYQGGTPNFKDPGENSLEQVEAQYQRLLAAQAAHPDEAKMNEMPRNGLEESQQAWRQYREQMVQMLSQLRPDKPSFYWGRWIEAKRLKELRSSTSLAEGNGWIK